MSDTITFNRADEKPYGAFSNLFRRPLQFMGREFPTAEHAYQFGKAAKPEVREWLMSAPSPSLLAMAAHGLYRWDIVPNWSKIKIARMRCVLQVKFGGDRELYELLMLTGVAELVETPTTDSAVNRFWGRVNGKGENMLGVMLMGLRQDFQYGLITPCQVRGLAEGIEPDGTRCAWYAGKDDA